jgi:hypothetical protein
MLARARSAEKTRRGGKRKLLFPAAPPAWRNPAKAAANPEISHRSSRSQPKHGKQDEQDLQDRFCLRPTGLKHSVQLNPATSCHPVHPVHPVEKSVFDLITKGPTTSVRQGEYFTPL